MEIILNAILGATISNLMKNIRKIPNIIVFCTSLILASVVAES